MFLLLLCAPKDRFKTAGQNLFKFTYHLYRSQQRCCSLKSYFENKFPIWPKISIYFHKIVFNKKPGYNLHFGALSQNRDLRAN